MRHNHVDAFKTKLLELQQKRDLVCPVGAAVPEGRVAYTVPSELRPMLVCIISERVRLNANKEFVHNEYYVHSSFVEQMYKDVVSQLRLAAHFPEDAIIELHTDWMYSYTTLERERGVYEAERAKNGKVESEPESGLSFEEMKIWPDPRGLLEQHLSLNDKAAFDRAVGRNKSPKAM